MSQTYFSDLFCTEIDVQFQNISSKIAVRQFKTLTKIWTTAASVYTYYSIRVVVDILNQLVRLVTQVSFCQIPFTCLIPSGDVNLNFNQNRSKIKVMAFVVFQLAVYSRFAKTSWQSAATEKRAF